MVPSTARPEIVQPVMYAASSAAGRSTMVSRHSDMIASCNAWETNVETGEEFRPSNRSRNLVSGRRGTRGADQPVRLLQDVGIGRLLAGQETDRDKQRTAHQADQHDFAVRSPVGVVK